METRNSLERAGGALATRRPRRTENAAAQITDFAELRKIARIVRVRRCLQPEEWSALRWDCYWNQTPKSERGGSHA